MRKRFMILGVLGIAASVKGAVVTYTLSLHETATCTVSNSNVFTVWVTVSNGDNSGLFAYGVDLKGTGDAGGPTTLSLVNRTPNATFDVDENDPNFDPNEVYPTKYIGFGTGRAANGTTGVVSGVQDLAKDTDLIRLYGFGQSPGNLTSYRPPPGPIVPYKNAAPGTGTDTSWGTPCAGLPAGTARLLTGTWTGTAPSFDTASVNNKASVWKISHPNGTENEVAQLVFSNRVIDFADTLFLTATAQNANQAVGGFIAVGGSNGGYSSEVDPLVDPSVNKGSAPIQTIGDESGNVYVMAKLAGTPSDISAVLNFLTQDVDASDPQFAALHAAYDGQFGAGGFNALFKFPNAAGPKVLNWDFELHPGVTIDQLAAVPEPTSACLLLGSALVMIRRRRGARV